ncbi:unnamed protein product, partial [Ceratitis capitata]
CVLNPRNEESNNPFKLSRDNTRRYLKIAWKNKVESVGFLSSLQLGPNVEENTKRTCHYELGYNAISNKFVNEEAGEVTKDHLTLI